MRISTLFCSFLIALSLSNVYADSASVTSTTVDISNETEAAYDYETALNISQSAIGTTLANYDFTDAKGNSVNIDEFSGKPLIISMVFTSCYKICPMTTRHLSKIVEKARDALGEDSFNIAVIGFDTINDTPDAMQYFANKQGISDKNWHLLSMDEKDVSAFSRDTGFIFTPSSANGFDHLIQATIIDEDGKVYRQVYGQAFDTPLLVDPLLELILGRRQPAQSFIDVLSNKIKLFCTTYDPFTDDYYYDYSFFVEIFVGITVIIFVINFMWREMRKNKIAI